MNYDVIINALTEKIKSLEEEVAKREERIADLQEYGLMVCIAFGNQRPYDEIEETIDLFRRVAGK